MEAWIIMVTRRRFHAGEVSDMAGLRGHECPSARGHRSASANPRAVDGGEKQRVSSPLV